MKIAHLSDLHCLSLEGVPWRRFMNKRLTGWANLRLKRGAIHRTAYVHELAREIARRGADHVVVTGDLTNLALEGEFELARGILEHELAVDPSRITLVPGNHDLYTRGALASRRFERLFAPWLKSDLPELAVDTGGARFPIVKLCAGAAIIGLSSAVPRPPLVAAGEIGRAQLAALANILAHPEVKRRTVVLAVHHPIVEPWPRLKAHLEGLRDADALMSLLQDLPHGLVLHGHLHRRQQRTLLTRAGKIQQIGATSASLHHASGDKMAGYNLYEIGDHGALRVEAVIYDPAARTFRVDSVPRHV